jgi:dTDP-4-dehydrorhamnose reductase
MAGILLVGANGQVGWEIARQARIEGLPCHALDRGRLDITAADAVFGTVASLTPFIVINAAAYTNVDKAETDADAAFAVNRDGAAHLARACAGADIPLIHISTDYVFDGTKTTPYREDDPVSPLGIYGESKLAGEAAVRERCPNHVILRTAWVYGVHGQNFVKTMLRLGRERERIKVVDDQFGNPTFAGDLARAILALARRVQSGPWPAQGFGTFHLAGEGMTNWCGFARAIFEETRSRLERVPEIEAITTAEYSTPAKRPPYSVLDCSRFARIHSLALRPWKDGLAEMLETTLGLLPTKE